MTQTEITPAESNNGTMPAKKVEDSGVPVLSAQEGYAYFEGRIIPMGEAKVSVATHALHYGTACFEGIRAYWNADHEQLYLLKLREHYERMANSCNLLRIRPKESLEEMCQITVELLRRHGYRQDVYVRPLAYKSSC